MRADHAMGVSQLERSVCGSRPSLQRCTCRRAAAAGKVLQSVPGLVHTDGMRHR